MHSSRALRERKMGDSTERGGLPWGRWAVIVGLPLLTAALAHLLFVPQYQTNDDVAMMMFASGVGLGPEPKPYLLFMNPLPGQLLSSLYHWWPGCAWYALFMLSARVLAGMSLTAAVLPRRPSLMRVALLTAWFVAVEVTAHVCPQFSITAAAATQAAVLLWLSRGRERPWNPATLAAFLGLIGLGVMIRPDHALLIGALTAPLVIANLVVLLWSGRKSEGEISFRSRLAGWARRTGWPFLAAAVVVVGLLGYQWWFYASSPGWRDFFVFNSLRGQVTDLAPDSTTDTEAAQVRAGWSSNDLAMLRNWFFADREVYSRAKLRAFLQARPHQPVALLSWRTQAQSQWRNPILRLLLATAVFPAFFLPRRSWLSYGSVCAAVAGVWLVVVGMLHHYCPPHFIMALLTFIGAVGITLAAPAWPGLPRTGAWTLGAVLLVVPGVRAATFLRERSQTVTTVSLRFHEQLRTLDPRPDQLYVVWAGSLPFEYVLPYDSLDDLRCFKMLGLGCCTNTPITDQRLREFGISDLVTALYTRDDVFLIANDSYLALLQTYVAEHRGLRVEFRSIFTDAGRMFNVYQVRRTEAHASPL
jgi:hypothetical protein